MLLLADANTYTGSTIIQAGTLRASTSDAFVQNGHALTVASLFSTSGTIALGGTRLILAQTSDTTFSGGMAGTGSFTKQG